MRRARIRMHGLLAGELAEADDGANYMFTYAPTYAGPPVSLTLPVTSQPYTFVGFPPFFDGLLPEGLLLEALLRRAKLDRSDRFGQLVTVGADLVGAVTVEAVP